METAALRMSGALAAGAVGARGAEVPAAARSIPSSSWIFPSARRRAVSPKCMPCSLPSGTPASFTARASSACRQRRCGSASRSSNAVSTICSHGHSSAALVWRKESLPVRTSTSARARRRTSRPAYSPRKEPTFAPRSRTSRARSRGSQRCSGASSRICMAAATSASQSRGTSGSTGSSGKDSWRGGSSAAAALTASRASNFGGGSYPYFASRSMTRRPSSSSSCSCTSSNSGSSMGGAGSLSRCAISARSSSATGIASLGGRSGVASGARGVDSRPSAILATDCAAWARRDARFRSSSVIPLIEADCVSA